MNDKKDPPKKTLPGSKRRPPASLFLWLLAFLVLASLIVFNSSPYFSAPEEPVRHEIPKAVLIQASRI